MNNRFKRLVDVQLFRHFPISRKKSGVVYFVPTFRLRAPL
jgi:hypothetical protein